MYDIFKSYVNNYDLDNKRIKHKYEHSLRVAKEAEEISMLLKLSDEDKHLATLIGLLHDIGRFEQIKRYNNFRDDGFDHGEFAIKLLFDDNLIEKFGVNKKYYPVIKRAIFNHNKLSIESNLTEHELLHANIVRDADKLDNIKFFAKGKRLDEVEEDIEITSSVMDYIRKEESVPFELVKNGNDNIAVNFGFIFDVNFDETVNIIYTKKLYENFYDSLKYKEYFKEAVDIIVNYIEKRLKGD